MSICSVAVETETRWWQCWCLEKGTNYTVRIEGSGIDAINVPRHVREMS